MVRKQNKFLESVMSFLRWQSLLGLFLFFLSAISYFYALSLSSLNLLYPMTSLTYVWTLFLGKFFLGEKIGTQRYLAVGIIVVGIVFVLFEIRSISSFKRFSLLNFNFFFAGFYFSVRFDRF